MSNTDSGWRKRQIAPAQQEPWNEDEWRKNNWRCGHGWLRGEQCEICNAAQEPVACLDCGSPNIGIPATYDSLINSVKAQPEQEPVVCKHEWFRTGAMEPRECRCIKCGAWNTTPLQRKPLTDEQVNLFINGRGNEDDDDYVEPTGDGFGLTDADLVRLVRRVEAAHGIKEKNT